jgi:hypothetical protein
VNSADHVTHRNIYSIFKRPSKFYKNFFHNHIFTRMSAPSAGFGLEIGFVDHFNTRLLTTLNYRVIADLHNLQITADKVINIFCLLSLHQSFPGNSF